VGSNLTNTTRLQGHEILCSGKRRSRFQMEMAENSGGVGAYFYFHETSFQQ